MLSSALRIVRARARVLDKLRGSRRRPPRCSLPNTVLRELALVLVFVASFIVAWQSRLVTGMAAPDHDFASPALPSGAPISSERRDPSPAGERLRSESPSSGDYSTMTWPQTTIQSVRRGRCAADCFARHCWDRLAPCCMIKKDHAFKISSVLLSNPERALVVVAQLIARSRDTVQ
jgi:hypothetical protein